MVFERVKHKSAPNPGTQTRKGVSKKSLSLSLCAPHFGIWSRVRYFPRCLVHTRTICRESTRIPLLPKDHQRRIDPNARKPGIESGPSVKAIEVEECS